MRDSGGERVPLLYRLVADRSGQSTAVGFALIIAITVIGTGFVITLGAQAIDETEQSTTISRGEHAMTRFDSRSAMVALGETQGQAISLAPSGDGQYETNPSAGWIRVSHQNYTDGKTETIYNATLGSVTYRNGNTVLAYQGGGVWRQTGNGSTMISPPEFHYRGATLTLPVIRVVSQDAGTGNVEAYVERVDDVRRIYPNETSNTGDGPGAPYDNGNAYRNPVVNGTVFVTIKSDYYKGWAQYFRTRTRGTVTMDHANQTTKVELETIGRIKGFKMTNALDSDGLRVQGQSTGHSVTDFDLTFKESGGTINNVYFSFHAQEGPHRMEVVIHVKEGTKCNDGLDPDDKLGVYYFYKNRDTGAQHEWSNTTVNATRGEVKLTCDGNEATVHANLTGTMNTTYGDVTISDQGTYYDWDGSASDHADFNHTEDGEPTRYFAGDNETTYVLTRHYFALMGNDFQLRGRIGTGSRGGPQIDIGGSGGYFDYEAGEGAFYITYLHISENKIRVELR